MSRGTTEHPSFAVDDTGAEMEVIGGVGWKVLNFYDKSETLGGALKVMGTEVLPSVDAVTAVEDSEGRVLLLGLGNAAYDRRKTQNESPWNSHHLRVNKVTVSNVAKELGGDQCIMIQDGNRSWITIPLNYNGM